MKAKRQISGYTHAVSVAAGRLEIFNTKIAGKAESSKIGLNGSFMSEASDILRMPFD